MKKIAKGIGIGLGILAVASLIGLIAMPYVIFNKMIDIHVDFKQVYDNKDFGVEAERKVLETQDNLKVMTYKVEAEKPVGTVIFISGIHNPSVTAFWSHSKMVKNLGFSSYLLELRAHGESEGEQIGMGFTEPLDVKAVVEDIQQDKMLKDLPIVVFGLSMGGATAINSMGSFSEIDGLISLSAYSSWEDVTADQMKMMDLPNFYIQMQKPFVKLYTLMKYGFDSASMTPKQQIRNLNGRPAFLIHSDQDSQVPFASFQRLKEAVDKSVGSDSSTINYWILSGDNHMILENEDLDPELDPVYKSKIEAFLVENFTKEDS